MPDASPVLAGGLKGTFQAYEQDIRVRNYQLCGILAAIFMVAGSSLDWVVVTVYPHDFKMEEALRYIAELYDLKTEVKPHAVLLQPQAR
jgi:hypothetical protein